MTIKKITLAIAIASTTACVSAPRAADYADAASTAAFMANGGVEVNPLLAAAGDAAPIASIGASIVARTVIDRHPDPETREKAHTAMSAIKGGVAASNIHLAIAGAPSIPLALVVGGGYWLWKENQ